MKNQPNRKIDTSHSNQSNILHSLGSKTLDELVEYFLDEKRKGMGFSEIRKILESKNIENERIKVIIRTIDSQITREETIKSQNQKARELIYIGAVVTLTGLIITAGTYLGLINTGNSFLLAYGPILAGIGMLFSGLTKYKRL
jgi:hypothetical protein